MTPQEHYAESERLLSGLAIAPTGDAAWQLVLATRALAHAQLATVQQPAPRRPVGFELYGAGVQDTQYALEF